MKPLIRRTLLSTCGLGVLTMSGCSGPSAPTLPPLPSPITKKVSVTVTSKVYTSTISRSYSVGLKSTPTVAVIWNRYGFQSWADGRLLFQQSDDLAFRNGQTAKFDIIKTVSISGPLRNSKTSSSKTVTVRRGVKATF